MSVKSGVALELRLLLALEVPMVEPRLLSCNEN